MRVDPGRNGGQVPQKYGVEETLISMSPIYTVR